MSRKRGFINLYKRYNGLILPWKLFLMSIKESWSIRMLNRAIGSISFILLLHVCSWSQKNDTTFTNPLLPSGADPWSIYKDGFYYYTHTIGDSIALWKTKNLAALKTAERKTVFVPPSNTSYSKQLWAPEIHFINSKWYVYFAADNGNNNNHRMYV